MYIYLRSPPLGGSAIAKMESFVLFLAITEDNVSSTLPQINSAFFSPEIV